MFNQFIHLISKFFKSTSLSSSCESRPKKKIVRQSPKKRMQSSSTPATKQKKTTKKKSNPKTCVPKKKTVVKRSKSLGRNPSTKVKVGTSRLNKNPSSTSSKKKTSSLSQSRRPCRVKLPKTATKTKTPPKSNAVKPKIVGIVTHYFPKIKVAVVELKAPIRKEDRVLFRYQDKKIPQIIRSIQMENKDVNMGRKGQLVGLKVTKVVTVGSEMIKAPS